MSAPVAATARATPVNGAFNPPMPRMLLAGRVLTLLAFAGLGSAFALGTPRWVLIAMAGLGALGLACILLSPPPPDATGLGELLSAAAELDEAAGPTPDRLNTDTSQRALAADAARRIRAASAQIRAEREAASRRHAMLLDLLNAVDEPILAANSDGRIIVGNAPALVLLEARPERILSRPIEEAFTQPDLHAVIQAARNGTPTREEVRIPRQDGVRIWAVAAFPFGDPAESPRAIVLTLRDVTEQSLALQVKTDFVANASHELRTPVSAIRMAVETLEGLGDGEQAMRARLMSMITSHTHRLEELIRDLLDLSRLESTDEAAHLDPVPAASLAAALAPMFEGVCRDRKLKLRFDLAPELEHLRSDRNLLLLVLSNLIDNACKFAFEGTEVLVTGRPGAEPVSTRFEVTDRGVGIPIHQQQRIFERFFQVDEARTGGKKRGTGLGLSIVKHALRRLGGTIRVQSVWQRGTTMIVDLPGSLPTTTSGGRQHPTAPSAAAPSATAASARDRDPQRDQSSTPG